MDLTEFLTARLDEDEQNARFALDQWPATHFTINPGSLIIVEFHKRHDPARVLRGVAAKRKLLGVAEEAYRAADHYAYYKIRAAVASSWSDHPDYAGALASEPEHY